MIIDNQIKQILRKSNISTNICGIIITCVDPNYPVSSLGMEVDVKYDLHHVQIAGKGFIRLNIVYNKGTGDFSTINPEQVYENLPNGVIQIAYHPETVTIVFGIPGDVYAFRRDGKGFAFGMPDEAPAKSAHDFLRVIIEYSAIRRTEIQITAMQHPDCGLFANNVGKFSYKEHVKTLTSDGKNYDGSPYYRREMEEKKSGAEELKNSLISYGIPKKNISMTEPTYKARPTGPGILKAVHDGH